MSQSSYDNVPYKSASVYRTHPNHLAAIAMLFGMKPTDIRRSRILELGCGDGSNLIPMAYGLPDSELIGVDLAGIAIVKGQTMINSLNLKNITLLHKDITELNENIGLFDYIIAHGLFSWVPPAVREKILSLCKNNLSPQGVAFISYNTYPGWHLWGMSRNIMRFHADRFSDPKQKTIQALAFFRFVSEAVFSETGIYKQVLTDEYERLSAISEEMLYSRMFHDHLSDTNDPMYFSEFIAQAEKHGLQYLSDAESVRMRDLYIPPRFGDTLGEIAGSNIIIQEQISDFLKGRTFRQTLLCHADVGLNRVLHPKMMENFCFSCPAKPAGPDGKILTQDFQELITRKSIQFIKGYSTLETDNPVVSAALLYLSDIYPMSLSFKELLAVGRKYGGQAAEEDAAELCDTLMSAFSGHIVRLGVHAEQSAREPGEYPTASAVARQQILAGDNISNLFHQMITLENTYGMFLLPLMDGTRSKQNIREEAVKIIRSGNILLNGKPASEKSDEELLAEIDSEMTNCAKYGLLMA